MAKLCDKVAVDLNSGPHRVGDSKSRRPSHPELVVPTRGIMFLSPASLNLQFKHSSLNSPSTAPPIPYYLHDLSSVSVSKIEKNVYSCQRFRA